MCIILERPRELSLFQQTFETRRQRWVGFVIGKFMLIISEGKSINSINFRNCDVVKNDFDNLMLVMEKHNPVERQIFNVDKAG